METETRVVLTFTELDGPWPTTLLCVALTAGVALVIWQYSRERGALGKWARRGLAALRCVVWLVITGTLSGPALAPVETRRLPPEIVVLRDSSQSMAIRDAYEGEAASRLAKLLGRKVESFGTEMPTRIELARQMSQTLGPELGSRARVHVVDFATDAADSIVTPPLDDDGRWPTWQATGRATDLGAAIRAALDVEGTAAAVIVTDGQHSTRDDPRGAAREAGRRGVPLFIVGVGSPRRPRDVRVANVYCRPHVWKSEPFEVEVLMTYHVPDATTAQLDLIERRADHAASAPPDAASSAPDARVVESAHVKLSADANQLVHRFSHRIESPGRYSLAVRLTVPDVTAKDTIATIAATDDREASSAAVEVLDKEQLRVLVVAGEASWDFQQVERLLNREQTVAASCWLQSADPEIRATGGRLLERLPATQEELDWYDVLVLLDPDATLLPESWGDLVIRFAADHAGGVLYAAGPRHAAKFLATPVGLAVRRLLPVELPEGAELQLAASPGRTEQAWQARVAAAQADHPVLRLAGESTENRAVWEQMPPLFTSFPVRDARPASRTLLEHGDPTVRSASGTRPLLVVGQYRSAHAAFLGFQGIWRWRGVEVGQNWGDRLWLQLVRYLAEGRAWEGRRHGRLQTDRPLYEPGDRVTISLQLDPTAPNATSPSDDPISPANPASPAEPLRPANAPQGGDSSKTDDSAAGRSSTSGGIMLARISDHEQPVPLHAIGEQPGLYEGVWIARRTGPFTVAAEIAASTEPLQTSFRVEPPQAEAKALWLDETRLRELAELSQGRYFEAADAPQVVDAIPDRRELVSTRRPAEPLWDRASVLFVLTSLLCVEWTVRRRYKLV